MTATHILTIDFETFYDTDIGFKKQTTEQYVRDPRFEIIGVAVQVDGGEPEWFSGTKEEIATFLHQYDWEHSFALAHNAIFDGAILSWHFGITPKAWFDTLSMARPLHGVDAGGSLKALAERYEIGEKGTEVVDAFGKRRFMFDKEALTQYGEYCKNDVALTYKLFNILNRDFPVKELKLIDLTIKMFTEPVLEIDTALLEEHLVNVQQRKTELLDSAAIDKEIIMSNDKFAEALISLGVQPPTKVSARTGKQAWAFAKTDQDFKDLLEHPNEAVQNLVAARLGVKTTLEETRTQRFIEIGKRGPLPVPLKYYAAHTGRWGGSDKINLQNLPARGGTSMIKRAIKAPPGYTLIDCDSSQIEARTLAWLAYQDDLVTAFSNGEDVYKIMAGKIYNKPVSEITSEERFFGKTVILGCGYGMGAKKFHLMLKLQGMNITEDEALRIIKVYRNTYPRIKQLWYSANDALGVMLSEGKEFIEFGRRGVVQVIPRGFELPNKLKLTYNNLRCDTEGLPEGGSKITYSYDSRKEKGIYIYGGKVVENVVQALARCVVGEQMVKISKRYRVVLTVHDAIMCVVKNDRIDEARSYVEECMRWVPDWASGLPVNCESGVGENYADC